MSDAEWRTFFELCGKVMNLRDGTWQEKKAELKLQAQVYQGETSLGEIVGWFDGQYDAPPADAPK